MIRPTIRLRRYVGKVDVGSPTAFTPILSRLVLGAEAFATNPIA